jgi:hypothetical protein
MNLPNAPSSAVSRHLLSGECSAGCIALLNSAGPSSRRYEAECRFSPHQARSGTRREAPATRRVNPPRRAPQAPYFVGLYWFMTQFALFLSLLAFIPLASAQQYTISTVAGFGLLPFGGAGASDVNAFLIAPNYVAADSSGNTYLSDTYYQQVSRIDAKRNNHGVCRNRP